MSTNNSNTGLATTSNVSTGVSIADRLKAQQAARSGGTSAAPPAPAASEDAMDELARLRAANAALTAQLAAKPKGVLGALSVKVSEKGGVSIYGTGRFPVTVYGFNAIRLFDEANIKNVFSTMASGFASLSFKTAEQRDSTAKALREKGYEVSDESIAAARLTADAG